MAWQYVIDAGTLFTPSGLLMSKDGYSGAPGFVNNPQAISLKDEGPIPVGLWHIGPSYDDPEKGPCTMALTPAPETNVYGRTAFRIHGDSIQFSGLRRASQGCIILARFAREALNSSSDKALEVLATQPS